MGDVALQGRNENRNKLSNTIRKVHVIICNNIRLTGMETNNTFHTM